MTTKTAENLISCPKCKFSFALADSVEKDVRAKLQSEFGAKEKELAEAVAAAEERAADAEKVASKAIAAEKAKLEAEVTKRLASAKESLEIAVREDIGAELKDAQDALEASNKKVKEAQAKELELRKQQRELAAAKEEFELEAARKLDEARDAVRLEVEGKVGERHQLQELEWKKKQGDMEKLINELRLKSEQGSQQAQGEVLELEVEAVLKETFPHDSIEPVAKGVVGADVLQVVKTRGGAVAGSILWEIKRTKNFSDAWVAKLKDNQRSAKAEVAAIITTAMPEGVRHVGQVDGIWITDFASFTGIALALRASLLEVAQAKVAQVGKKEKAEEVYEYLNGVEFRGRVEGLVESFVAMREGIETERRAFEKIWSRRDKELLRAMTASAGFYGDLQGLIGTSLKEIPLLSLESK